MDTSPGEDFEVTKDTEVPYLFANGVRLGRVVYQEGLDVGVGDTGTQRVFLMLGDFLGSTSIVIDKATSEVVERSTYQAYGGAESDYRPERWKSFREDYRFTGKEEDVEVGLTYFGKRYLNALLGRWVSADPLGIDAPLETDLNLYAYVRGQALKNIDPLGLSDTRAQNSDAADRRERGTEAFQDGAAAGRFQYGLDQAYAAARDDILNRPTPQASQGGAEGASGVEEPSLKEFEAKQRADLAALDAWYAKHSQHVGAPLSETYNKGYDAGYRGAQIDERTKVGLEIAIAALPVAAHAARIAIRAIASAARGGGTTVREGIYEFVGHSGKKYVGQSGDIPKRIAQHRRTGKLPAGAKVEATEVRGGKTAREVAEQRRIDELGGIDNLENKKNPIGMKRRHLLYERPND